MAGAREGRCVCLCVETVAPLAVECGDWGRSRRVTSAREECAA